MLGMYSATAVTGTMAAGLAADAEIFQFRFTHASRTILVHKLSVWAGGIGAFAAGFVKFEAMIARAWTVAGTGGGTLTLTGDNNTHRATFAASTMSTDGEIRIATTAALTAGTKTLDTQGICSVGGSTTATAGTALVTPMGTLFDSGQGGYPIVLVQNEGIIVRATVPATGTWTGAVNVTWQELANF